MARTDNDTWDLAFSVGATATMVAAGRARASRAALIDDPFAEPLVRAVGIEFFVRWASGELDTDDVDFPDAPWGMQRMTDQQAARTRYIDMLLELDHVSPLHNILASAFVWILLAGYIVFPATFNSLQKSSFDDKADTKLKAEALATARNLPLLYVAAVACGVGVMGSVWLWWKHRQNYVWVVNRIFLPSLLNSVAGLVSTLVNVYSAQDGMYLSFGN